MFHFSLCSSQVEWLLMKAAQARVEWSFLLAKLIEWAMVSYLFCNTYYSLVLTNSIRFLFVAIEFKLKLDHTFSEYKG